MKSYNQPSKDGITSILDKLVLQMTGSELLQVIDLIKTTCSLPDEGNGPRYVYGISALSDFTVSKASFVNKSKILSFMPFCPGSFDFEPSVLRSG